MPSAPGVKLSAHSATPQLIGDSRRFEPEFANLAILATGMLHGVRQLTAAAWSRKVEFKLFHSMRFLMR